jgi:hypothetical protein
MSYTQQNGYHVIANTIDTAVTECSCGRCGPECECECEDNCSQEDIKSEDMPETGDFQD